MILLKLLKRKVTGGAKENRKELSNVILLKLVKRRGYKAQKKIEKKLSKI
jgi:hypothetical protein